MRLAGSLSRKLLVTAVAAGGFVWLYEVTIPDSKYAALPGLLADRTAPQPGARLTFSTTAYCKGHVTASGVPPRRGVAASDPSVLPVGSVVELELSQSTYNGIYSILDTGPAVQGRELDLYMWSCHEALAFGRQRARVTILRLGWTPKLDTPTLLERVFRRPGKPRPPPPLSSRPLPRI